LQAQEGVASSMGVALGGSEVGGIAMCPKDHVASMVANDGI